MHPYLHANSLASASIDALKAAQVFLANNASITINKNNVYLTGFSQGGYAAMATHRELQKNYSGVFNVAASYPSSGPYDLSGTMYQDTLLLSHESFDKTSSGDSLTGVYFLPYIILSYRNIYNITDSIETIFIPELQTIESKYNMITSSLDIISYIRASVPSDVMKHMRNASYLDDVVNNPNHIFRQKLAENDVYQWLPAAPVQMIVCDGDGLVPLANTTVAHSYMTTQGATDVTRHEITAGSHPECLGASINYLASVLSSL
jgi:acetyl esterase/lipase